MDDIVFTALIVLVRKFRLWVLSQRHLYLARKKNSLVELLISMHYDEEESRCQYPQQKNEIFCEFYQGVFHGIMENPQSLTLIEAFHIPIHHQEFLDQWFSDKSGWPTGVEYYISRGKDWQLSIKVYVDLDYKDSPKDYVRGYMNYLRELQTEFHKKYNTYKSAHPEVEQPQYNISFL